MLECLSGILQVLLLLISWLSDRLQRYIACYLRVNEGHRCSLGYRWHFLCPRDTSFRVCLVFLPNRLVFFTVSFGED